MNTHRTLLLVSMALMIGLAFCQIAPATISTTGNVGPADPATWTSSTGGYVGNVADGPEKFQEYWHGLLMQSIRRRIGEGDRAFSAGTGTGFCVGWHSSRIGRRIRRWSCGGGMSGRAGQGIRRQRPSSAGRGPTGRAGNVRNGRNLGRIFVCRVDSPSGGGTRVRNQGRTIRGTSCFHAGCARRATGDGERRGNRTHQGESGYPGLF